MAFRFRRATEHLAAFIASMHLPAEHRARLREDAASPAASRYDAAIARTEELAYHLDTLRDFVLDRVKDPDYAAAERSKLPTGDTHALAERRFVEELRPGIIDVAKTVGNVRYDNSIYDIMAGYDREGLRGAPRNVFEGVLNDAVKDAYVDAVAPEDRS